MAFQSIHGEDALKRVSLYTTETERTTPIRPAINGTSKL